MMDTVPEKSGHDYGSNYIRIVSTFIPRIVWPTKPLFGRDQWVSAWIAGSELERDEEFTGPGHRDPGGRPSSTAAPSAR